MVTELLSTLSEEEKVKKKRKKSARNGDWTQVYSTVQQVLQAFPKEISGHLGLFVCLFLHWKWWG